MRTKGKRTKGMEEARPFTGMSQINQDAAGVDIGAVEIVACVGGDETTQMVKAFGNYTVDLQAIGKWLHEYQIKTVAMESTGVYWIPLFEELERQGFECLLISSRSLRRVPGRKSDIQDAQWIQTLLRQLRIAGKFISSAGRVGGVAHPAETSRPIARTSCTAYPAYPEGIVADERAVITGIERCDRRDGACDHSSDSGRRTRPGEIGGDAGSELQEERRRNRESVDRDVAGGTPFHRQAIAGDVRLLHEAGRDL